MSEPNNSKPRVRVTGLDEPPSFTSGAIRVLLQIVLSARAGSGSHPDTDRSKRK
ncbi:hypothetical protein [Actinomadura sp. WAC 06369]|uniref:hypothetical protein n=1 Tax=Actinomadura sp. WAC 06369 TaxID=2203193 RepID=UPI0013159915|nr:hypothetical protein [Actinomadura sp. WAC 06369]